MDGVELRVRVAPRRLGCLPGEHVEAVEVSVQSLLDLRLAGADAGGDLGHSLRRLAGQEVLDLDRVVALLAFLFLDEREGLGLGVELK